MDPRYKCLFIDHTLHVFFSLCIDALFAESSCTFTVPTSLIHRRDTQIEVFKVRKLLTLLTCNFIASNFNYELNSFSQSFCLCESRLNDLIHWAEMPQWPQIITGTDWERISLFLREGNYSRIVLRVATVRYPDKRKRSGGGKHCNPRISQTIPAVPKDTNLCLSIRNATGWILLRLCSYKQGYSRFTNVSIVLQLFFVLYLCSVIIQILLAFYWDYIIFFGFDIIFFVLKVKWR